MLSLPPDEYYEALAVLWAEWWPDADPYLLEHMMSVCIAFDTATVNRPLCALAANHQAQSGQLLLIRTRQQQKRRIAHLPFGVVEYGLILGSGKKSVLAGKSLGCRHCYLSQEGRVKRLAQAANRLRPLARRAARILRPFLVAMRARKPWARLRLSTLG